MLVKIGITPVLALVCGVILFDVASGQEQSSPFNSSGAEKKTVPGNIIDLRGDHRTSGLSTTSQSKSIADLDTPVTPHAGITSPGERKTRESGSTTKDEDKTVLGQKSGTSYLDRTLIDIQTSTSFGGLRAEPGLFPFICIVTDGLNDTFTGTIVTDRWVVSTSYYVYRNGGGDDVINRTLEYLDNGSMYFGGKSVNIAKGFPKNPNEKIHRIIRRIVFPDGTGRRGEDVDSLTDLVVPLLLLKTDRKIEFGARVGAIRLGAGRPPDAFECGLVGYAELRSPVDKKVVKWKNVLLKNGRRCNAEYGLRVDNRVACSSGVKGRLACERDAGSPVVCAGAAVGFATVRAAMRGGRGDSPKKSRVSHGCEPRYAVNVFHMVAGLRRWMGRHVKNLPEPVVVDWKRIVQRNVTGRRLRDVDDYPVYYNHAAKRRCVCSRLAFYATSMVVSVTMIVFG